MPLISPSALARQLGLPSPTAEQEAVITASLEPMVVIAGAGSGKTETMAARVVWLVANRLVAAHEVLGLTFTRKAAGELAERLRIRLAQLRHHGLTTDEGEPTVVTYHTYAGRLAAEHELREGQEPITHIASEAECWQIADKIVHAYDGDMSAVEFSPDTVTEKVLLLAGQLSEHLVEPKRLASYLENLLARINAMPSGSKRGTPARVTELVARITAKLQLVPLVEQYKERKRALGIADFGDQVARAATLARDHIDVGESERRRFPVVLLDEYQDTSHAQLVLLRSLFGSTAQQEESPRRHAVTAVGDPCQSIYGWRGASAGNLGAAPENFGTSTVRPLSTSWRNGAAILDAANVLSEPLRDHDKRVPVSPLAVRPGDDGKASVMCSLHSTIDDEAEWIASEIAAAWQVGAGEKMTGAVLVRKRDHIDRIAEALRHQGLPVEIVGLGGLLATPEVRDVVTVLTVLADAEAGHALMRLLTGPHCYLGPHDIANLHTRARQLAKEAMRGQSDREPRASLVEALDDLGSEEGYTPEGYRRLERLSRTLRALRGNIAISLPELVIQVERAFTLDIEVAVRNPEDPIASRMHLDAFVHAVGDFVARGDKNPSLPALLAYLRAAEKVEYGLSAGKVRPQPGAIQILTVHAAKGLEWDVVAVAGLAKGVFPPERNEALVWTKNIGVLPFVLRGDAEDLPSFVFDENSDVRDHAELSKAIKEFDEEWLEHTRREERRLAYVAVTRARNRLLISGYWWDSASKPRGPSAFLEELRLCLEADGRSHCLATWTEAPESAATNPLRAEKRIAVWPIRSSERRIALQEAAAFVQQLGEVPETVSATKQTQAWEREATLLLTEREELRQRSREPNIPSRLAVGHLVLAHANREELLRRLRRPVPQPPATAAQSGTTFHTWLEKRFGTEYLFDVDFLEGSQDASDTPEDVQKLIEAFERSVWAGRVPHAVEVPFTMVFKEKVVSGRIDAVYSGTMDGQLEWEIVDWKTGRKPSGQEAEAAAVQLATYRYAWAEMLGIDLEQVSAAFHYVRTGETIRPGRLLNRDELAELLV